MEEWRDHRPNIILFSNVTNEMKQINSKQFFQFDFPFIVIICYIRPPTTYSTFNCVFVNSFQFNDFKSFANKKMLSTQIGSKSI